MPNLTSDYIYLIDDLKEYLETAERTLEADIKREAEHIIIERCQSIIFEKLDGYLTELEKVAAAFNDMEHLEHKQYLQEKIHPLALKAPFNRRCLEKPLGYPGDYLMMEMIYSDPLQGKSLLTRLLNAHSLSLPIAQGVRARCEYIKKVISGTINNKPNASIFSVGAGSGKELRDFLKEDRKCSPSFFLLDREKKALEYIRKNLNGYTGSAFFINKGVKELIRKAFSIRFNLIYSLGLFDYLPEKFARRVVQSLYASLEEGGILIIGNAKSNPFRVWMEHGVEWFLIYRNEEELLRLAEGLSPLPHKIYIDKQKSDKLFIFMTVEK